MQILLDGATLTEAEQGRKPMRPRVADGFRFAVASAIA